MKNTLYTNDNLYIMNGMNSQSVDLIYLDPPFNSKRMYSAPSGTKAAGASFKDSWTWKDVDESCLETMADKYPALTTYLAFAGAAHSKAMMAYLTFMAQRIVEMHRILKHTGSMYLHCDPTASHYLKQLLDIIFGKNNFRNEIVWCYKSGGQSKRWFGKKHDVIFLYSKTDDYNFYPDNIRVPYDKGSGYAKSGIVSAAGKKYMPNPKGKLPEDWWEIDIINPLSKERTGYPTQKPLALLRRIIIASSSEGDIVLDPFCGCATTCVAAHQLGRKWIGIDTEEQAAKGLIERLSDDAGLFSDFVAETKTPKRTDIKEEPMTQPIKERLYADQEGKCRACGVEMRLVDVEIDHIVPRAKGGSDYYENYQLLCPHCNRTKGDRPMEYLRMKIEHREKIMKTKVVFGD